MMLQIHVMQNQWLMLASAIGLAVLAGWVMSFVMMWKPRVKEGEKPGETVRGWLTDYSAFPWVVILTIVGTTVFAIVFTVAKIIHPPNW
jgi:uncharacterized membrane protein